MELLTKITIWYSVANGADGSAYPRWFLSSTGAEDDQLTDEEGWGESCTGSIETFIGSDVHKQAVCNEKEYEDKPPREEEEDAEED